MLPDVWLQETPHVQLGQQISFRVLLMHLLADFVKLVPIPLGILGDAKPFEKIFIISDNHTIYAHGQSYQLLVENRVFF
ncbi:hypothetical protein D3C75_1178210 [compost metagenome]